MSDVAGDFLGAFAVVERGEQLLFVGNDRRLDGRLVRTWDLPGGRVEAGERIHEALVRELREETGLLVVGMPRFLFVQEGERRCGGRRVHTWRSFFFAVDVAAGEPVAGHEVREVRWCARRELGERLRAPYHDSFRTWLANGGQWFHSVWDER